MLIIRKMGHGPGSGGNLWQETQLLELFFTHQSFSKTRDTKNLLYSWNISISWETSLCLLSLLYTQDFYKSPFIEALVCVCLPCRQRYPDFIEINLSALFIWDKIIIFIFNSFLGLCIILDLLCWCILLLVPKCRFLSWSNVHNHCRTYKTYLGPCLWFHWFCFQARL